MSTTVYLTYFQYNPRLHSVVGIRLFGTEGTPTNADPSPCRGAVAIQWTRRGNEIIVERVWDFGINPISLQAALWYAQDLPGPVLGLPPVPIGMWQQPGNRYAPICPGLNPAVVGNQREVAIMAHARSIHATSHNLFNLPPMIVFDGAMLSAVLTVIPPGLADLQDLTFNLAETFHDVCRMAPPFPA